MVSKLDSIKNLAEVSIGHHKALKETWHVLESVNERLAKLEANFSKLLVVVEQDVSNSEGLIKILEKKGVL